MVNWPDARAEEPLLKKEEFTDLLQFWYDWKSKRSSNMIKLGLRVDNMYQGLTAVKRRAFCAILVADGEFDEELRSYLTISRGSLERLTYDRIDTGTKIVAR